MKSPRIGILVMVGKFSGKLLTVLGKLFKMIFATKSGLALASMAAYSYLFSWKFALVLIGAVFIHESGHYWAMKRCGIKTKGIYLIPLLGGVCVSEEAFGSRGRESFIALFGPVFGLITAIVPLAVYYFTLNPFYAAIASWIAFFNIFNLLPVSPLDGGRIVKSVLFSIGTTVGLSFTILAMFVSVIAAAKFGLYIFIFLLYISLIELSFEYNTSCKNNILVRLSELLSVPEALDGLSHIPVMTSKGIIASLTGYFGLISMFFAIMYYTNSVPGAKAAFDALTDAKSHSSSQPSALSWTSLLLIIVFLICFAIVILSLYLNARSVVRDRSAATKLNSLAIAYPHIFITLSELIRRQSTVFADNRIVIVRTPEVVILYSLFRDFFDEFLAITEPLKIIDWREDE